MTNVVAFYGFLAAFAVFLIVIGLIHWWIGREGSLIPREQRERFGRGLDVLAQSAQQHSPQRPLPFGRIAPKYIRERCAVYQDRLPLATSEGERAALRSIIHDLETVLELLTP